ncbi:methylated-DNA--[protein]-cysteine S-methyltransferase [Desulfocicer niacini]
MMYYTKFNTRFCEVILAGDEKGLSHLHLNTGEGSRKFGIQEEWELKPAFFEDIKTQILEFLDGSRKTFDVRLNPAGTEFQKKVWEQLRKIPFGHLASYGEIAKQLGNPKASRAVGAANGKNPIPLIIPCHRVVGANGDLTGFAHGLAIKEKLIGLEKGTTT